MIRPREGRTGLDCGLPANGMLNKKGFGLLLVPADLRRNCGGFAEKCYFPPGAHFPNFVLHRGTHFHELRKVMGASKNIDSSAAFLFEVPGSNSPLLLQELQIG